MQTNQQVLKDLLAQHSIRIDHLVDERGYHFHYMGPDSRAIHSFLAQELNKLGCLCKRPWARTHGRQHPKLVGRAFKAEDVRVLIGKTYRTGF